MFEIENLNKARSGTEWFPALRFNGAPYIHTADRARAVDEQQLCEYVWGIACRVVERAAAR